MPIYEYRRPDGTTFEIQQSFSDDALSVDPDTGVPVERVLHAPAVHFKGKGFYSTDYGKRARHREGGESGDGAASDGKGSSKGAESDGASTEKDAKQASPPAKDNGAKSSGNTKTAAANS